MKDTSHQVLSVLVGTLLLLLGAAACEEDGHLNVRYSDDRLAPTGEVDTSAMLEPNDVGSDYSLADAADADDDLTTIGCLRAFRDLDDDADSRSDVHLADDDSLTRPQVTHQVLTFPSEQKAEAAMTSLRGTIEGCETVRRSEDGADFVLTLSAADRRDHQAADEQLTVVAEAEVERSPFGIDFEQRTAVARHRNALTVVRLTTLGEDSAAITARLSRVAVDRLLDGTR